jgi:hypothetical protein
LREEDKGGEDLRKRIFLVLQVKIWGRRRRKKG